MYSATFRVSATLTVEDFKLKVAEHFVVSHKEALLNLYTRDGGKINSSRSAKLMPEVRETTVRASLLIDKNVSGNRQDLQIFYLGDETTPEKLYDLRVAQEEKQR